MIRISLFINSGYIAVTLGIKEKAQSVSSGSALGEGREFTIRKS